MKISVAQIKPINGDIAANISNHLNLINLAASSGAELIVFPELSLTGYVPEIAKDSAIEINDSRLSDFQKASDEHKIIVAVGAPTNSVNDIYISLILFSPNKQPEVYSKQYLYGHEHDYFKAGTTAVILEKKEVKIAPAICYELSVPEHSKQAHLAGAHVYMCSVAKTINDMEKTDRVLPNIAKNYNMVVLMSNCVGSSDAYNWVGYSSIWNKNGKLMDRLDTQLEGLILYDLLTEESELKTV